VKLVDLDELSAEFDSPDGVLELVQCRRPDRDPHHVRDDQHDRPADGGHGGQTNLKLKYLIVTFICLSYCFFASFSLSIVSSLPKKGQLASVNQL